MGQTLRVMSLLRPASAIVLAIRRFQIPGRLHHTSVRCVARADSSASVLSKCRPARTVSQPIQRAMPALVHGGEETHAEAFERGDRSMEQPDNQRVTAHSTCETGSRTRY